MIFIVVFIFYIFRGFEPHLTFHFESTNKPANQSDRNGLVDLISQKKSRNIKFFRIKPSDTTCIFHGNSKDLILNFKVE